jgi:hypothetical protein
MGHCFFQMDDYQNDNEDFNMFSEEPEEGDIVFYSQNFIHEPPQEIRDDFERYFDV